MGDIASIMARLRLWIGPWIVSFLALLVSAFTLLLHWRWKIRERRPILVFTFDKDRWFLQNVGYGPTLAVEVFAADTDFHWTQRVRIPPMAKDSSYLIHWRKGAHSFAAIYTDYRGKKYSSQCIDDDPKIRRTWRFPRRTQAMRLEVIPHWKLPSVYPQ